MNGLEASPMALRSDAPAATGSLSICLVAHFAYGALAGGSRGHIGGVERQVSVMARWLAARGHRVSVVTWDEGQADGLVIDGVRVLTLCRQSDGIPGLRFWHPRWTTLNRALGRADADLYYQNCGEYVTGQVALWCRRHARTFVYSAASDADCDARLPVLETFRERALYRFGLRHADRIIVQTRVQQRMLETGFARRSVVLAMPCPDFAGPGAASAAPARERSGRVLWIGRVAEVKRPDRLLDIAEACPDLGFDLVGPPDDSAYSRSVMERAHRTRNVTVHGAATREQMAGFYRQAGVLCCTSDLEGFPNTFLESWSQGLPVVSTIDPDGLIQERGLGAVATGVPGIASAIRSLLASPERWRAVSTNVRAHYLETYAVDRAMLRFERLFVDVVSDDRLRERRGDRPSEMPGDADATPGTGR